MARTQKQERALDVAKRLGIEYPEATCALHHKDALQLLVATILSAQCTDARVNQVTPALFKLYPDAEAFATADPDDLRKAIHSCGFFNQKAKSIQGATERITREHGGVVPSVLDDLVKLPGVGRKTANCVLGTSYGQPAMVIDTHMVRIMGLLKLTASKDPVVIERDLMKLLPPEAWVKFTHRVIVHGRAVCVARRPLCQECLLADICPSAGIAVVAKKTVTKKTKATRHDG
jgi:endonuclease III